MNVVSIGTDRKIFEEGSAARTRMIEYGQLFTELHIIVFAKRSLNLKPQKISENIWIYPTNSLSKFLYIHDAKNLSKKIILDRNFVVTAQDPFETGAVGMWLKKKYNFKLQLQVHTDLFSPYFKHQSLLNRIRIRTARRLLPYADEIRVVSERIKKSIIQELSISENKIDVLSIYVDKEKYSNATPSRILQEKYPQFNFVMLMASRLAVEKNIGFALDVFKDVLTQFPKTGLVIVGEGQEEQILKKKVATLGIEKSVVFESWQQNLVPYYTSAQAFLQASSFEGYGMTLIEAGLAGLPIVTSDVGIAGDVLKDGIHAMVCPIGDHGCFVKKISEVISNAELRMHLKNTVAEEVKKSLLADKASYLAAYKALLDIKSSLLFITQKMDINDDILGAYHGWVTALASHYKSIIVICLYEGKHDLPKNVKVLSLGKETGVSRFKYISRFFRYSWGQRKNYDAVFVHMNVEYILLGWWLWRLLGKKVAVWYNHTYGTWKGKLAFNLAHTVFHTSPFAFSSGRKNSMRMPAGILVENFKSDTAIVPPKNSVLYIGRLSAVKNVDVLIQAITELNHEGIPCTLDLYGKPDKPEYLATLKNLAKTGEEKHFIAFKGSVPNKDSPQVFNAHEVCVNLTPRGNFDKTVLEAMACEKISVVSSEAFKDSIPREFMFKEKDVQDLKRVLKHVFSLSDQEKKALGEKNRKDIVEKHSLTRLVQKIYSILQ